MDLSGGRQSTNVEDRRGRRLGPGIIGGGLGTIAIVVIGLLLGVDPSVILDQGGGASAPAVDTTSPADDDTKTFVSTIVGFTEDTWSEIFRAGGETYRAPTLVLFTGAVESACGLGQAAMGPFYCPEDQKVYLDLSFFQELRDRFQAPGDFAQAYVIAHEVGHHVQNLLNLSSGDRSNRASVQTELQADCLAGVWAVRTQRTREAQSLSFIQTGDVEEALNAASMIGDDKLQQESQGRVRPETFTHGSAAQRVSAFKRGFQSGEIAGCR